jgi:hypothetical protein
MMKKVKIVTSIYSDLYGTKYGGRIGRRDHYRWSLLSLLKMTDADFVCYTSENEYESLVEFFYKNEKISEEKLKLKISNLDDNNVKELIKKWKNYEMVKTSDRCFEIQYMKFFWSMNELQDYDYIFWFDAGLSHCGLIPNKYLTMSSSNSNRHYYESSLFNNDFLENLINFSQDKFVLVAKENSRNYWSGTVNYKHFTNYNSTKHVIGGFFGGHINLWSKIIYLFTKYLYKVTEEDKRLYHEEDIMTLMFRNHEELFNILDFDTWWHENERISGLNMEEHLLTNKSFYKILEELN